MKRIPTVWTIPLLLPQSKTNEEQWQFISFPFDETNLDTTRGLSNKKVSTKCVNEESLSERRSYSLRLNGPSLLICQDLSPFWLEKIIKAFSCKKRPFWCSVVSTILTLCWVWTAPQISEEEGNYALRFYRWF